MEKTKLFYSEKARAEIKSRLKDLKEALESKGFTAKLIELRDRHFTLHVDTDIRPDMDANEWLRETEERLEREKHEDN